MGASSMAGGLRAAVDPCIGRVDSSRPVGGSALPMGTDRAKTPTERRVSPPSVGQTPLGSGWRGFLPLPFRQLKPPLGAPHASPQLPLSRQYPSPLLGYPFDRDVHSRRSRLFEWALGWGCGFCVAAGWRLFTEPRLRDHMLCRERGEIKKALSIAVSARQRGIRGSSPPVVEAATTCPGPLSRLWIPPPASPFHETPLERVLPGRLGHQEKVGNLARWE